MKPKYSVMKNCLNYPKISQQKGSFSPQGHIEHWRESCWIFSSFKEVGSGEGIFFREKTDYLDYILQLKEEILGKFGVFHPHEGQPVLRVPIQPGCYVASS